jgi:hypothetical protein
MSLAPSTTPEQQLEHVTREFDADLEAAFRKAFAAMSALIGPNGARARIAGRIAYVARMDWGAR